MSEALKFIAACIINSEGRKTDALVADLSANELKQLAAYLVAEGRGDLVSFGPAGVDPEVPAETEDGHLREREARAIAVDAGIRASRFNAALPLGEIEGAYRNGTGWAVVPEGLYDWIDNQVALREAAEPDVELVVPEPEPTVAEPATVGRIMPARGLLGEWLWVALCLLLVAAAIAACCDFIAGPGGGG